MGTKSAKVGGGSDHEDPAVTQPAMAAVLPIRPGEEAMEDQEALKRRLSAPDPARQAEAFELGSSDAADDLQAYINARHRVPSKEDLDKARADMAEIMRSGKVHVIIPMREQKPTVVPALRYLTERLPNDTITVMDAGSSEEALEAVRGFQNDGVRLYKQDEVLAALRWDKLLPVLGVTEPPKGKGMTVLALLLLEWARLRMSHTPGTVIFQTDSDILEGYEPYNPLELLLYPLVTEEDRSILSTQVSAWGRNNDIPMAARASLLAIEKSSSLPQNVRLRARQLRRMLASHKWMLAGEMLFTDGAAMRRVFGTGYSDETLKAISFEDDAKGSSRRVIHVETLEPRLDAPNDYSKETIMMQRIAMLLMMVTLHGTPTDHWDLEVIQGINRELGEADQVLIIPESSGPVRAQVVKPDRIIPSVNTMVEGGLINEGTLRAFL